MKVFLSWSGDLSHKIACVFRDWLPSVLQYVQPYVSSEDIDKGARWSTDIAQELEASAYGIIVLTRDNTDASWIAFEAGALSKALEKGRVSPFLVNLKRSEIQGPLLQFQSTIFDKEDIFKLLVSINSSADDVEGLEPPRVQRIFDVWWPQLKEQLDSVIKTSGDKPKRVAKGTTSDSEILEEILELVRTQQRILADPSELVPPRYLVSVLGEYGAIGNPEIMRELPEAVEYLSSHWSLLQETLDNVLKKARPTLSKADVEVVQEELSAIKNVVGYLRRRSRSRHRYGPRLVDTGVLRKKLEP